MDSIKVLVVVLLIGALNAQDTTPSKFVHLLGVP